MARLGLGLAVFALFGALAVWNVDHPYNTGDGTVECAAARYDIVRPFPPNAVQPQSLNIMCNHSARWHAFFSAVFVLLGAAGLVSAFAWAPARTGRSR